MGIGSQLRKQPVEFIEGHPGRRLEPQTTQGAPPLWCAVEDGAIGF